MKLSARNLLKGKISEIREGQVTAVVTVDIGGGNLLTSSFTMTALRDLGLTKGLQVVAIIKASEVILGTQD